MFLTNLGDGAQKKSATSQDSAAAQRENTVFGLSVAESHALTSAFLRAFLAPLAGGSSARTVQSTHIDLVSFSASNDRLASTISQVRAVGCSLPTD